MQECSKKRVSRPGEADLQPSPGQERHIHAIPELGDPYLYFEGKIGERNVQCVVDTGATVAVVNMDYQAEVIKRPIGPPINDVGVHGDKKATL